MVWALIFVAIFGPGPVAGIWAIAMRSIGFLGKLVAEAIEEVDQGTVEAIEATGASRLQVLLLGVLPQVIPVIVGTTIYRWDINIRESMVLGFVGAGGIGIQLYSSINLFQWDEVAVMLIAILGVVVVSEFISAAVRAKITLISPPGTAAGLVSGAKIKRPFVVLLKYPYPCAKAAAGDRTHSGG